MLAILGLSLGKAPGLYFGNFGPKFVQGSGPLTSAMLGLNLGRAPGLYFDNFGPESGQGSGPLLWPFWA